MKRYRNTWAEINLQAIGYNIQQLKKLLPSDRKVMGVVKADGYGHGSVRVARTLLEEGVDYLMVALLEEAVTLRENGIVDVPILVIGRVAPEHAVIAADLDITISVFHADWVKKATTLLQGASLSIHVEFETGFNRTGIGSEAALKELVEAVKESDTIDITGAYTHFATADEINSPYYEKQKKTYEKMLALLKQLYLKPMITHIGNSAAGIQYPEQMLQYTRFGVSLYGLYPSKAVKGLNHVPLRQAFSLYSELIAVKQISKGEVVGYGATYKAEQEEWIGTVPIGYADGWSRSLQGFHVLVAGKKMPIVGRICMDMMMVKLDKPYEVGQKVTLIGKDKGAEITMDDVADYLHTINYEIPCMLTSRVPRVYT